MKKSILSIAVGLVCLAPAVQGQISVTAAGSQTFTFDAAPPVEQFVTWGWTGGGGDILDLPACTNYMYTLQWSTITAYGNYGAIPSEAAYGTHSRVYFNTADFRLFGHPSGYKGNAFVAILRNDAGFDISSLTVQYDWAIAATASSE